MDGSSTPSPERGTFSVRAIKEPGKIVSVDHLRGRCYRATVDGIFFFQMGPQDGEWLEAEHFFPGDPSKEGKAVTIKGPFQESKVDTEDGWELQFSFDLVLHYG